jgi:hypothetical protein
MQQPQPFNPGDVIAINLTANEWNLVLSQLQEGPWKIVAPLIGKIQMQAAQQQEQTQVQGFANGEIAGITPAEVRNRGN